MIWSFIPSFNNSPIVPSLPSSFQTFWQDVSEGLGPHLSPHYKAWALQPQPQLSGRRQPAPAQSWKHFLGHKLQLRSPDQRPQPHQWAGLTKPLWSHSRAGQQWRSKQVGVCIKLCFLVWIEVLWISHTWPLHFLSTSIQEVCSRGNPSEVWIHAGLGGQTCVSGVRWRCLGLPLWCGLLWSLQGLFQEDHPG